MKSNIKLIIIFASVCAVCIGIAAVLHMTAGRGETAEIIRSGKVVKTVSLNPSRPYEFDVEDENGGFNRIRVEKGQIAVVEADCPDRLCVKQGFAGGGSLPIVCLPHKLVIEVSGKKNIDAETGGI